MEKFVTLFFGINAFPGHAPAIGGIESLCFSLQLRFSITSASAC